MRKGKSMIKIIKLSFNLGGNINIQLLKNSFQTTTMDTWTWSKLPKFPIQCPIKEDIKIVIIISFILLIKTVLLISLINLYKTKFTKINNLILYSLNKSKIQSSTSRLYNNLKISKKENKNYPKMFLYKVNNFNRNLIYHNLLREIRSLKSSS